MKVIKRQQVTEVVTNRQVSHSLALGNSIFNRHETIKVTVPYMDCEVIVGTPIVKWSIEIGNNTVRYLSKKELNILRLEDWFNQLDINDRNGNGK
jgi:hypothetical protein